MQRLILGGLGFAFTCLGFLLLQPANCLAGNWPGWRGPGGMGQTDEKTLPLKWDGKTGENVLWKVPLGGIGNSSPIVWGDKVFVTISRKQTNKEQDAKIVPEHWVACFSTADGKELWRTAVDSGHYPRGYGIYAVPTPVTDGKYIYSWFSSGVFAALDFDGKMIWRSEVPGELPKNIDGLVNSPLLYKDTVIRIVNVEQRDAKGVVQALDKKTGDVKWEKPLIKSGSANASPLLLNIDGKDELLVPSGNMLDALNPADGSSIWSFKRRMGDLSPVYASGILFTDAPGGPAIGIDPLGQGDITKTNAKWKTDKTPASYAYASPVISGDCVYRAARPGLLTCWKLSTGEEVFSEQLKDITSLASPVATADGLIYFATSGKTYIIKAGPKLQIVAENELGGFHGNNGGSPAISNGRIYLRDAEPAGPAGALLYCIGSK
ncbi:MAG TPA: PQQ-binding-like beta-propeller repeat protein [Tepidisphaeraceae bacterium]|nr:PQQ-binding-like beta-propeller repeat protein [Tepidisphaeraceae bacterium]